MLFTKRVAKKLLDLIFSYTETTMESLNLSASDDVSRAYFYGWYYFSLLSFGINEKVINHVFTLMVDYIRSLSSQDSFSHLRSQTLEYTLSKTVTHYLTDAKIPRLISIENYDVVFSKTIKSCIHFSKHRIQFLVDFSSHIRIPQRRLFK